MPSGELSVEFFDKILHSVVADDCNRAISGQIRRIGRRNQCFSHHRRR
ncbi:Aminopeptidase C [Pseudomonas syringae pv. actinidiae]|uniref:Aminopeptidase C n=1 Tax=Pseudomonas syringae pv. actinidiae TaxID=103796 RepID=A0AAN4TKB3_PSESF|nr:Aminopeptidase C [Pseudomonas syringae pv. actinidiae]